MKNYTDIDQSKKLGKILPTVSADMWYSHYGHPGYNPVIAYNGEQWFLCQIRNSYYDDIPCWSLAALLNILPKEYYPIKDHKTDLILGKPKDKWCVLYWDTTGMQHGEETLGDNPIDACVDMIVKLKEKNMI